MRLTIYFKEPLEDGAIAIEIVCSHFSVVDDVVCADLGKNTFKYYYNVRYVVAKS